MKAAQLMHYGGLGAIQINEVAKPQAGSGEVLVAVQASAANPFDWKLRDGRFQESIKLALPATLGGDFAGKIVELGEGVEGLCVGQAVYGQANAAGGRGAWAQFAPVKAQSLAPKPNSLDFTAAAAAPLVTVSAYQALVETMNLQPGQKILIHGGAGGIGSMAIQLAKHLGAQIATTASDSDADFVRELGAEHIIDYKSEDFSTMVKDYDAVFDTVGGDTNYKSYLVLKPGGQLVSMVSEPDKMLTQKYQVTATHQSSRTTPERLTAVTALFDQGALSVQVDKVFPFEQADQALEYLKTGSPRGKVVLDLAA